MSSFCFYHAADIHLDSPLKGLAGREESAAERIRGATREAFDRLVGLVIEEQAAFLVLAGDLYDGDWRDCNTGLFFVKQMGRLRRAGVPVYLLHGNHDAESRITGSLTLPENVHVFGSKRAETFEREELNVALHGQSFRRQKVTENLAATYPEPVAGAFNIGVLHTGLGGRGEHANYAPCSLDDLKNKGYDYWALGHVHQAEVVHERPHVVFPGNLQGRHVRETGGKGACLVTVEDGEVADLTTVYCDEVRWAVVEVGLESATSLGEAEDCVRVAIDEAVAERADGRMLVCRIRLRGCTEIHEQLLVAGEQLLAEARASAADLGKEVAWVEKVVVETEPVPGRQTAADQGDAIGELRKMLREEDGDPELLRLLEEDVGELARRLPREVSAEVEDAALKAVLAGDYTALIAAVTPYLSARLTGPRRAKSAAATA